jgi:CRISPR/Cas system CSM-associated protein Csm3 (group 7 of RAMP superfamily)
MMTTYTIFTGTLVQDSALSVSGIDRESTSDQPFALVGDTPVLSGRGLKGAAVAMARRCFTFLPRSITEERTRSAALVRSAWELDNAHPADGQKVKLALRAGVGIRQKTGARASGVLYDREVVPAGTRWQLCLRVSWHLARKAGESPEEVEQILGYILHAQWSQGRCWLGGGASRGLGWCHLEGLAAYRLDQPAYERWLTSQRKVLPPREPEIPRAKPTRTWCFRTLDLKLHAGEYRPDAGQDAWGLDMLAIGPHSQEINDQPCPSDHWVHPPQLAASSEPLSSVDTDRAIAMESGVPLLPGSSLRGPMRHAFSRALRGAARDPHLCQGAVGEADPAGQLFGTVAQSSALLIRDGHAEGDWFAARLHMHAEDELSAGSYGSAKRDAVRLLKATFPIRLVVEGPCAQAVEQELQKIDRLVALGALGHLLIGGHKTRGAGACRWVAEPWRSDDVQKEAEPSPPRESPATPSRSPSPLPDGSELSRRPSGESACEAPADSARGLRVEITSQHLERAKLTLEEAAQEARSALGDELTCWWCEPRIDLEVRKAPVTFGWTWPQEEPSLHGALVLDEVVFLTPTASWRAARTATGIRAVLLREAPREATDVREPDHEVRNIPAHLHGNRERFPHLEAIGTLTLREWRVAGEVLGYTARKGI